ncbi:MAG TPA: hypothetical protein VJT33_05135 [bacterium]|nr:hypothetical protein [bacterium]
MMMTTTRRRAWAPVFVDGRTARARSHLRYAVVYHRGVSPLHRARPSGAWARVPWWHRMIDDQDLVGAKLLALAALLALTALVERVV